MIKRIFLSTLIALAVTAAAQANSATAKITFKAEAQVQPGCSVTVKDIAGIQASREVAAKIGDIMVTRAPQAGQSRTLEASYIKQKICLAAPKSAVSISGPQEIKLVGMCTKVSAQELADAAEQFALAHIPGDGRDYEVKVDPISRDIIAPAESDMQIEPEMLGSEIHPGLNSVRLSVTADGKSVGTAVASVRIKVTASVLMATDTIPNGAELTSQNTTWEKRDVTKIAKAIVDKGGNAYQGFVARKAIQPGAVITSDEVALPAAVKQGDTISLVVRCGQVVLQTSAEAKQAGAVGETIRVLTPVSAGEVRARIIEPGLAEIKM